MIREIKSLQYNIQQKSGKDDGQGFSNSITIDQCQKRILVEEHFSARSWCAGGYKNPIFIHTRDAITPLALIEKGTLGLSKN